MTALNHSTLRRLQSLQQLPSVWEGDRRTLTPQSAAGQWLDPDSEQSTEGDCILWVDGTQGVVRAMDIVLLQTGPEAVVRTLIKAMEQPHSPGIPGRPKKIVVRDRQLQFYLRGVLQNLDITVEYVPELPLIDEIFRGLQEAIGNARPPIPPQFVQPLTQKAFEIWDLAPWELLADHEIVAIELNYRDIGTLYASVMGMLGMEFGVLLYRSVDSLRQFRQRAISQQSVEQMQEAFLGQDCLFMTFEAEQPEMPDLGLGIGLPPKVEDVEPMFGNLHPLEGMRSSLYEEEAEVMWLALEALHRFIRQHRQKLQDDDFPTVTSRYRISLPPTDADETGDRPPLPVKVWSMNSLAMELLDLEGEEEDSDLPMLHTDLVPENAFFSLGMVPWNVLELLRGSAEHYQHQDVKPAGDGLPVVMIQTSRPKAKALIAALQTAGGVQSICFNPGSDPMLGDRYDIGLLQTVDGDLHVFGEFGETDPVHVAARKKWDQRCKKTKGCCGLIIAKGLTGASRGNPQLKDMMAVFETRSLSSQELGLGTLQLRMLAD